MRPSLLSEFGRGASPRTSANTQGRDLGAGHVGTVTLPSVLALRLFDLISDVQDCVWLHLYFAGEDIPRAQD